MEAMTEQSGQQPILTPKRKREALVSPLYTTATFAFEPRLHQQQQQQTLTESDDDRSPHSKVVHKFRGLAIHQGGVVGGGGVATAAQQHHHQLGGSAENNNNGSGIRPSVEVDFEEEDYHDVVPLNNMRKRRKVPEIDMRDADEPALGVVEEASSKGTPETSMPEPDPALLSPSKPASPGGGLLQRAYPSINRLSESKSRGAGGRRRTGTPPPGYKKAAAGTTETDEDPEIVEPIRAALTWHDDEITMYDPDDEDDDGTGINGIGFKPTPALAYARAMKRKQQLAEYKKRMDSEARARRSQRRHRRSPSAMSSGGGGGPSGEASRRVRFTEPGPVAETGAAVVTTG